jgi:hypothetical protein
LRWIYRRREDVPPVLLGDVDQRDHGGRAGHGEDPVHARPGVLELVPA